MEQTIMTTQAVADRYYELAQQGKWNEIRSELYSQDAENREPEHAASLGVSIHTKGLDAIMERSRKRNEMIETVHSEYCTHPIVGGNYFSTAMGRDITFKGRPRMQNHEIAVFGVKDGKIISEQFFY